VAGKSGGQECTAGILVQDAVHWLLSAHQEEHNDNDQSEMPPACNGGYIGIPASAPGPVGLNGPTLEVLNALEPSEH
jgi:hypothetical protein